MSRKLQNEIKLTRPFASLELEAFLNILRTAGELTHQVTALLRPTGVSSTAYNVLRILRGAGETGLPCGEIAGRMVTRVPDVTRLLDRLEMQGLVSRARATEDRRVVKTSITASGIDLLAKLDGPILELHTRQLGHLGPERLRTLIELLETARERWETD